jgi:hypothetical protein
MQMDRKNLKRDPWARSMTDREFAYFMIRESAPRFDGKDAERLSWMLGHYEYRQRMREKELSRTTRGDWWLEGDERWRAA